MENIEHLLARLRDDDHYILKELFKKQFYLLQDEPCRHLRSKGDFKAIVNAALLEIWDKRMSYIDDAHVRAILNIKIKNKTIDLLRSKGYNMILGDEAVEAAEAQYGKPDMHTHTVSERMGLVYEIIEKLPFDYKQVMHMLYKDQLTVIEIAAKLNISQSAVRGRKDKAIELIRQWLDKMNPDLRRVVFNLLLIMLLLIVLKIV
jgi:RNA polymerase sigma factor (sigma-70 family)